MNVGWPTGAAPTTRVPLAAQDVSKHRALARAGAQVSRRIRSGARDDEKANNDQRRANRTRASPRRALEIRRGRDARSL